MIFTDAYEVIVHHVKINVAVKDKVKQGDEIGNFTSLLACNCYDDKMTDHLHFKISKGAPVDDPVGELDSSSWAVCQIR